MSNDDKVQQNAKDIAVLKEGVHIEIQGLKDALKTHGDALRSVTLKLEKIFQKLSEFVITHKGLQDKIEGHSSTLFRVNNEVGELKKEVDSKANHEDLMEHIDADAKFRQKIVWIGGIGMGIFLTIQFLSKFPGVLDVLKGIL